MPDGQELLKFYNNILASKRITVDDIGTFDVFKNAVQDPTLSRTVYDNLLSDYGFSKDELGGYDYFNNFVQKSLTPGFQPPASPGVKSFEGTLEDTVKKPSTSGSESTNPIEDNDPLLSALNRSNYMMPTTPGGISPVTGTFAGLSSSNRGANTKAGVQYDVTKDIDYIDQKLRDITKSLNIVQQPEAPPLTGGYAAGKVSPAGYDASLRGSEYSELQKQSDYLIETRDFLTKIDKMNKASNSANYMQDFTDALTSPLAKDFFTVGITEMLRQFDVTDVARKYGAGEPITDDEKNLLKAYGIYKSILADPKNIPYQLGEQIAMQIPYMIQFAASGGVGNAAREGTNIFVKNILKKEITEDITKFALENTYKATLGEVAKRTPGIIAKGIVQTPMMPMTYNTIGERLTGVIDQEGNVIKQPTVTKGILSGLANAFPEVLTESMGADIMASSRLAKALGAKRAMKMIKPLTPIESFRKSAAFGSWIEQFSEEMMNNVITPAIDPETTYKDTWTLDNILTTGLSLAIVSGGMYATNEGYKAIDDRVLRSKHLSGLDDKVRSDVIKTMQLKDPNAISAKLENIITSNGLNTEQTKGVLSYAMKRSMRDSMGESLDEFYTIQGEKMMRESAINDANNIAKNFGYKDHIITITKPGSDIPYFITGGQVEISPEGSISFGTEPLIVTDMQGNKTMMHPKDVSQVSAMTTKSYLDDVLATVEMDINNSRLARETVRGAAEQVKQAVEPPTFMTGDKISYNGREAEVQDARNSDQGITAIFTDNDEVVRITPEEYQNIKPVGSTPAAQEQPASPVIPSGGTTEPGAGVTVPGTAQTVELETPVKNGTAKWGFTAQEDGSYRLNKPVETEQRAKAIATALSKRYGNLDFLVQDVTDKADPFALNQFVVDAKRKVTPEVTEDVVATPTETEVENVPAPEQGAEPAAPAGEPMEVVQSEVSTFAEVTDEIPSAPEVETETPTATIEAPAAEEVNPEAVVKESLTTEKQPWEMTREKFLSEKEKAIEILKNNPEYVEVHRKLQERLGRDPDDFDVWGAEYHKKVIEQALSEGKAVPDDVLKDYPELAIKQAEDQVDTNPTEAQKDAGNYQKGHVTVQGFDITIENPKGSTRSGVDASGKKWSTKMNNTYGYFKRTQGKDGDHIDVFIGDNPTSEKIYVVDQVDPKTGEFDEHKVMMGFNTPEEAKTAYMSNYEKGWKGLGNITEVPVEDFRTWLDNGTKRRKPFADYKETPEPLSLASDKEQKPTSVRDLAGMMEGEVSAAVFDALSKGDKFKVGKHDYEVVQVFKDKRNTFTDKKGKERYYDITKIRIKRDDGRVITSDLWKWDNGNQQWAPGSNSNHYHEQLSRDIEGDISIDLINENNPFHEVSDSYKLAQKTVNKYNQQIPATNENKAKEAQQKPKETFAGEKVTPKEEVKNRLVTDERYEELKKRMKDKLNNLQSGYDPEMFAIGAEMAMYHIEKGARKFAAYSKIMIEDLGDKIRPYLKSFYNGARDLPGMEVYADEMDDAATVKAFDVNKPVDANVIDLTNKQKKKAIPKRVQKVLEREPESFEESVLQFLLGGRFKTDDFIRHTGFGSKEAAQRRRKAVVGKTELNRARLAFLSNDGLAMDQFADGHEVFGMDEKGPMNVIDGIIDIILEHPSKWSVVERLEQLQNKVAEEPRIDPELMEQAEKEIGDDLPAQEKSFEENMPDALQDLLSVKNFDVSKLTSIDDLINFVEDNSDEFTPTSFPYGPEDKVNILKFLNDEKSKRSAEKKDGAQGSAETGSAEPGEGASEGKGRQGTEGLPGKSVISNKDRQVAAIKAKYEPQIEKLKASIISEDQLKERQRTEVAKESKRSKKMDVFQQQDDMFGGDAFGTTVEAVRKRVSDEVAAENKKLREEIERLDKEMRAEIKLAEGQAEINFADGEQNDEKNRNFTSNTQGDVSNRPRNSEPDSRNSADGLPSDGGLVPSDRGTSGENRNESSPEGDREDRRSPGGASGLNLFSPTIGTGGNNKVLSDESADENDFTRDFNGRGSSIDGTEGLDAYAGTDDADIEGADRVAGSFAARQKLKLKDQVKAENIQVKPGDLANIRETLPYLLPEQQEDVYAAERRFYENLSPETANGKAMLFTNGTGTGKTFVGLGIIKRFSKQGKQNILIVVPSQPKVSDWISDGKALKLNIVALAGVNDGGEGINITTYANFRENKEILKRDFDLIIYDESHRLMESKKGDDSATTLAHYANSNKSNSSAFRRLTSTHPLWKRQSGLNKRIREINISINNNMDLPEWQVRERVDEVRKLEDELKKVNDEIEAITPQIEQRANDAVAKTKVVFLSATPFKTHFNLRYANKFLFDWGDKTTYEGYSRVDPESRFFLDNFGSAYTWKYHRLQVKSDANPAAVAMQEIEFAKRLMANGVQSGRVISSERDYERSFPLVAGFNSELFNKAFNEIFDYESNQYEGLRLAARNVFFDYQFTTKLFEALKTSMSIERIKKHINLGRKVVVFHRRQQAGATPPFSTIIGRTRLMAQDMLEVYKGLPGERAANEREKAAMMLQHSDDFENKYRDLLDYENTLNYESTIDQISSEFGSRVAYINGLVSKKDKSNAIKKFNDDDSDIDIIVVQEEAGKEGISLHDTTGKHQRVIMSMSMPISSITALQIEGRIYRIGQESDAVFEYPLLGLNLETAYFGQNINRRLSTTENLAVADDSRDLIRSFAEGVLFNANTDAPSAEQGKGGKEYDRREKQATSEFQRAILVYNTNLKKRGSRESREGVDYFATPEPLGQKMVEWADSSQGEEGLEPSAGHGAIAMWFPESVKLTAIEPSFELYSKLTARAGGGTKKILNETFEALHIVNKFGFIVMNPPFGSGGKMAMDHIEKAFSHLKPNGRIVAIIPAGNSMSKRLDDFLYGKDEKGNLKNPEAQLIAEINLPSVTFQQAGTQVNTRVVVIDRIAPEKSLRDFVSEVSRESTQALLSRGGVLMSIDEINKEAERRFNNQQSDVPQQVSYDLSGAKTINELFERLENLTVPGRNKQIGEAQPQAVSQAQEVSHPESAGELANVPVKARHDKKGIDIFTVKLSRKVDYDTYKKIEGTAKYFKGYYSSFSKAFIFENESAAQAFVNNVNKEYPSSDTRFRLSPEEDIFYSNSIRALSNPLFSKGENLFSGEAVFGDRYNKFIDFYNELLSISSNAQKEFGVPVKVVRSASELPARLRSGVSRANRSGMYVPAIFFMEGNSAYDKATSAVVYLVANQNKDTAEAARSILHEIAGHHGMRQMFGQKYDTLLRQVWNSMSEADKRNFARRYKSADRLLIADEYLAKQAENLKQAPSFIKRAIAQIRQWLRRVFNIKWSDKDIAVLLNKSRENLRRQAIKPVIETGFAGEVLQSRFQIIGEKGADSMAKAGIASDKVIRLQQAIQMEKGGIPKGIIWSSTGWERGKDGKWRTELDDENTVLKYSIEDVLNMPMDDNGFTEPISLSQFMSNEELFSAIPELKDYSVIFYQYNPYDLTKKYESYADPKTKTISISISQPLLAGVRTVSETTFTQRGTKGFPDNGNTIKSNLLHEIQHISQLSHGFTAGGNKETLWRAAVRDAQRELLGNTEYDALPDEEAKVQFAEKSIVNLSGFSSIEEAKKYIYIRNAGEVEARNVQKRLRYRSLIRKYKELSATEDVSRSFQNTLLADLNEGIQAQIIGEKGYNRINESGLAANAVFGLQDAINMEKEGETRQRIRRFTGWERGKDGKWRRELNDQKTILVKGIEFIRSLPSDNGVFTDPIPITEFIKNDELFQAYPELTEYKLTFYNYDTSDPQRNILGFKDSKAKVIGTAINPATPIESVVDGTSGSEAFLNRNRQAGADTGNLIKSNLIHEIQHIVQQSEGFALGGNKETAWKDFIQGIHEELQGVPEYTSSDQGGKEKLAVYTAFDRLGVSSEMEAKDKLYQRIAGEVEARNVQRRMNASDSQRARIMLSETEDIAREDQIVLMESLNSALEPLEEIIPVSSSDLLTDEQFDSSVERIGEILRPFGISFKPAPMGRMSAYVEAELPNGESIYIRIANHLKPGNGFIQQSAIYITPGRGFEADVVTLAGVDRLADLLKDYLPEVRYSLTDPTFATPTPEEEIIGKPLLQTSTDKFREWVQDKMLSVRRLQEKLIEEGGIVTDESDIYNTENLSTSASKAQMEAWENKLWNPLIELVSKISKDYNMSLDDIQTYLKAKHAPERNKYYNDKNKTTDKVYAGRIRGYDSSDAVAKYYTDMFEAAVPSHVVEELWEKINAATNFTLDRYLQDGFLSREMYDEIKKQYKYYIPLRGWKAETADEIFDYQDSDIGSGFNPFKKAFGRKSEADDPLPYIWSMANTAIVSGNKNMVKQRALNLWRQNKDRGDLFNVGKVYIVTDPVTGISIEQVERPDQVLWDAGMVSMKYNPLYHPRLTRYLAKQHELVIMEGGQRYLMTFTDPNVAMAIKGDNVWSPEFSRVVQATIGRVTRYLSTMLTSKNPAFIPVNWIRDVGMASQWHNIREEGDTGKFLKNLPVAFTAIRRWHNGEAQKNPNQTDDLYTKWVQGGGATGYIHLKDIEQLRSRMERQWRVMLDERKPMDYVTTNKIINGAGELLDYMAIMSENMSRFATYLTSLELGRSHQQAISDSKNVTVNFNRKGRISGLLNTVFAFFNANIQGSHTLLKLGKDYPVKAAKVAVGFMVLGYVSSMLTRLLSPPDDDGIKFYDKLSPFIKQNFLVLPNPMWLFGKAPDKFVTIPLPWGFSSLYSIGVVTHDWQTEQIGVGEGIFDIVNNIYSAFSPINFGKGVIQGEDIGTWKMARPLVPTAVMPLYDIGVNEDFAGYQIAREPFTKELEKITPKSELGMPYTNRYLTVASRAVNKFMGGDEFRKARWHINPKTGELTDQGWRSNALLDINPSQLEHLIEGYTGGVGTEMNNIIKTISDAVEVAQGEPGAEVYTRNIPVLRRLYRQASKSDTGRDYYEMKSLVDVYTYLSNKYKHERDIQTYGTMIQYDQIRKSQNIFDQSEKQLKKLRERAEKMEDNEQLTILYDQMDSIRTDAVQRIRELNLLPR